MPFPTVLNRILPAGLLVVFLLGTAALEGRTLWVDAGHPAASDANPGTQDLPFATLEGGVDHLVAGDTLRVRGGVYGGRIVIGASGSEASPIVITAEPGPAVVVDGSGTQLEPWQGLVEIEGASWLTWRGFEVVDAGPHGSNTGIQIIGSSHVAIEGSHTRRTGSSGILVWESSDIVIAGNEVESTMTAGAASFNECITIGRTTRFEVRDNHVHDGHPLRGEGIDAKDGSSFGSVHHNHVHHVAGVGIYVDAWTEPTHDIDVFANRVHDVDGVGFYVGSEEGGLLEWVRFFNNVAWNNRYAGLGIHACCTSSHPVRDLQVINNTFWNNGWQDWGGGIYSENDQVEGLVIRNNAVAGNLSFEIAFEGADPATATLDHNLVGSWKGYEGETCGTACLIGDPLLADPAAGDFAPTAGSPLLDAGSADQAPEEDLLGTQRPQGLAVDIGAIEFVASGESCQEGPETLCLLSGRYRVTASWRTAAEQGAGGAIPLTADTGFFWFFQESNVELVVKVLDGCGVNGHRWVFAGGLTNVEVTLRAEDTQTGSAKTYFQEAGQAFLPVQDTTAFAGCG